VFSYSRQTIKCVNISPPLKRNEILNRRLRLNNSIDFNEILYSSKTFKSMQDSPDWNANNRSAIKTIRIFANYSTWRFITVFRETSKLVSILRYGSSHPPYHLYSHLRQDLQSFQVFRTKCRFLSAICSAQHISLDLITLLICGDECQAWSSSLNIVTCISDYRRGLDW
jgi:hypothetical protein